jgi:hypothetical protein
LNQAHYGRLNRVLYDNNIFLLTLTHFYFCRSYAICMGAWSLSFFCHSASDSLVSLIGATGSLGHGVVTTQSTSAKTKARSIFFSIRCSCHLWGVKYLW